MAKFTKLNIGDIVASSGGRVWKKLSVESAEVQDELAGTWVFNDLLEIPDNFYGGFVFNFVSDNVQFTQFYVKNWDMYNYDSLSYYNDDTDTYLYNVYKSGVWTNASYKTITITSTLSEVTNGSALLAWLKENATKQTTVEPEEPEEPEESLAGTWLLNRQFTATSGYGIFNVNCSTGSYDPAYVATQFGIGYSFNFDNGFTASTDKVAFGIPIGDTYVSRISSDYVVTFIDGDDINNSLLLTWLKANAIKQVDTNEDGGSAE